MTVDSLMNSFIQFITNPQLISGVITALAICAGCFLIGCLLRLFFGKRATAVRSVTTALGILITYILSHLLIAGSSELAPHLAPLPFVQFDGSLIRVFTIADLTSPAMCYELVNLILLAFLFGLMDDLLPAGKNIFTWLLLRCVSILVSYVGFAVLNMIFTRILPGFILQFAPIILVGLLALFLAVTIFKWLIGVILGISGGPILGAVYTFFISHVVGKQLTKSALTSGILYLLVYLANRFGYTAIAMGDSFNLTTALVLAMLAAVWYCVYKIF